MRHWILSGFFCLAALATVSVARAESPEVAVQVGHRKEVLAVAFSPGGETVYSGSRDGTLKIWDAVSGHLKQTLALLDTQVSSCAVSPDGTTAATSGSDPSIRLWDLRAGRLRASIPDAGTPPRVLAFSPDGKSLACAGRDGTITLRHGTSGLLLKTWPGDGGLVSALAFSPDGAALAVGGGDGAVQVRGVPGGEVGREWPRRGGAVTALAFSPDGGTLAIGARAGTVTFGNLTPGKPERSLQASRQSVRWIAFAPDGQAVATGGAEPGSGRLWDARTAELRRALPAEAAATTRGAFSPDGMALLTGGDNGAVTVWDPGTGGLLQSLSGSKSAILSLGVSGDGSLVASGGEDRTLRVWKRGTAELLHTITDPFADLTAVALSPDGRLLAAPAGGGLVKLRDPGTGAVIRTLEGHTGQVWCLSFSPDGRALATGSWDGTARLWNVKTGELLGSLSGHAAGVRCLAFSPDGRTLATGSWDATLRLWDVAALKPLRSLAAHTNLVRAVAFAPDGKSVASAGVDGRVIFWDLTTGTPRRQIPLRGVTINSIQFSRDSRTLISAGDDGLAFWDPETGARRQELSGHAGAVNAVALSADGRSLVSGGSDNTLRLWDPGKGTLLATLMTLGPEEVAQVLARTPERVRGIQIEALAATYLVVTPSGYYSGSSEVDHVVRFRVGSEVFAAEAFHEHYYRPELVRQSLEGALAAPPPIKGPYPPRVRFVDEAPQTPAGAKNRVVVEALDDTAIARVDLFLDGRKVAVQPEEVRLPRRAPRAPGGPYRVSRALGFDLPQDVLASASGRTALIRVIAYDEDGLESAPVEKGLAREAAGGGGAPRGRLLGLCVGITQYSDPQLAGTFAAADARDLAAAFNAQRALYGECRVTPLVDKEATGGAIRAALDRLAADATPADTVVLYFGGHAWRGAGGLQFAPQEFDRQAAKTGLDWHEVTDRLARVAARSRRVLLFLDVCHSGSTSTNEEFARAVIDSRGGIFHFAASKGSEIGQDLPSSRHGAFAGSLIEALEGKSAPAGEKEITVSALIDRVFRRVREQTQGRQNPAIPLVSNADLLDTVIAVRPEP